jgi:hypothetical protein
MEENVVFARVGWMESYRSSVTGEAGPIGGGKYNLKNLGWEKDNFLPDADGHVYGYFAVGSGTQAIDLFRVNGSAQANSTHISSVLVVFVAPHPTRADFGGPVVVGWYRKATLYREEQENASGTRAYRVEAATLDVTFVPSFQRNIAIPRAKQGSPGIGQSNVYYTRNSDGSKRDFAWIRLVLSQIEQFRNDSEPDPTLSAQIAAERKAGFQSDPRIRRAVEMRAMEVVRESSDAPLKDTSKTKPYDYSYQDQGIERYIEVKGSQQSDPAIILTRNEVAFAREHSLLMELCLVHSIVVTEATPEPLATGGILVRFPNWNPDKHELAAMQYQCSLNHALGSKHDY